MGAGRTIAQAAIAIAADKPAVSAAVLGRHPAATDSKPEAVGIHLYGRDLFQQFLTDDVFKPVDQEYSIQFRRLFDRYAKASNATSPQFHIEANGPLPFLFIMEVFGHQLRRPRGYLNHQRLHITSPVSTARLVIVLPELQKQNQNGAGQHKSAGQNDSGTAGNTPPPIRKETGGPSALVTLRNEGGAIRASAANAAGKKEDSIAG
jgi:hypothetical protein